MNNTNNNRRDQAVREILHDMCKGTWTRGSSHVHYAQKYAASEECVRGWAAEANRFLRMCAGNEQEIRDEIIAGIADARRRCIDTIETRTSNDGKEIVIKRSDLKAYIASWELYARVYGLLDHKKQTNGEEEEVEFSELERLLEANPQILERLRRKHAGTADDAREARDGGSPGTVAAAATDPRSPPGSRPTAATEAEPDPGAAISPQSEATRQGDEE